MVYNYIPNVSDHIQGGKNKIGPENSNKTDSEMIFINEQVNYQ